MFENCLANVPCHPIIPPHPVKQTTSISAGKLGMAQAFGADFWARKITGFSAELKRAREQSLCKCLLVITIQVKFLLKSALEDCRSLMLLFKNKNKNLFFSYMLGKKTKICSTELLALLPNSLPGILCSRASLPSLNSNFFLTHIGFSY